MALVTLADYYGLSWFEGWRTGFNRSYLADTLEDISLNRKRLERRISFIHLHDSIQLVRFHRGVHNEDTLWGERAMVKSFESDRLYPVIVWNEVYDKIRKNGTAAEGYDIMPTEIILNPLFLTGFTSTMHLTTINEKIPPNKRKPKEQSKLAPIPEFVHA